MYIAADVCMLEGPAACDACVHARNGTDCVPECPDFSYLDRDSERCRPCHDFCRFSAGCSGPAGQPGSGGCRACRDLWIHRHGEPRRVCLGSDVTTCDAGFYEVTEVYSLVAFTHTGSLN